MNELDAMRVFIHVAEKKSFTKAAVYLRLPNSSVSEAVRFLEQKIGVRLLNRTTRTVTMTQDGAVFYERCLSVIEDFDGLCALFHPQQEQISGRLRVDMPIRFARHIVIPKLAEFLTLHPNIQLELGSTDRRVDVVAEGFDCVVRIGVLADSSLIAKLMGHFKMVNCVSHEYVKRYGMPTRLEDLSAHCLVHYDPMGLAKPSAFEWFDGQHLHYVDMKGSVTVNNTEIYEATCIAGLGMIQVPEIGVRPLLKSGLLLEILPEYRAKPMPVSLIYPHRKYLSHRLQVFMAWLMKVVQPYVV